MTALPFAVALLAPALAAQSADWSSGPTMAVAMGLSIDAATVVPGSGAGTLLFTKSDFKTSKPAPWTVAPLPGVPNFATLPWAGLPGIDIDGLSMGLDYILSDPVGHIVVPPGSWGAITFSVTRGTAGVVGGLINGEVLAPGGAAADVFAYILPGSTGFPANWIDVPLRAQDSTELSLDSPGAPGNIDAMDVYLGLIFGENPQIAPLVPGYPAVSVFFSVKTASVPSVPAGWWGTAPASGATVLRTTWNATTSSWGVPIPFLTPAQLGLLPTEDVDEFGIDLLRGRMLLSTTQPGIVARDPLLYVELAAPGTNYVYRRLDNTPVSVRIGLAGPPGIDDIDGICALDPGSGSQPRLDTLLGSLQNPLLPTPPARLGVSVFRRLNQNGVTQELVSYMTGFPTPGSTPPGLAFCGIALGLPTNPYTTVAAFARPNPASPYFPFQGHPEKFVQPIPSSPVFTGLPVYFAWAAFDGTSFDLSLPCGITL